MTTAWMFLLVCLGFQYAQGDVLDYVRTHIPDSYRLTNPVNVQNSIAGNIAVLSLWNVTVTGLSTIDWVKDPVEVPGDSNVRKFEGTVFFRHLNFEGTFAPQTLGSAIWRPAEVSINWESNLFSIQVEVAKSADDNCQAAITNVNVDKFSEPQIVYLRSKSEDDKLPVSVLLADLHLIRFVFTPNIKNPIRELVLKELENEIVKQIISDSICQGLLN